MNWILLIEILYIIFIALVCFRIILDTRSSSKALAYILIVVFIPLLGLFIYFSFGINYRKYKIYNKKIFFHKEERKLLISSVKTTRDLILEESNNYLLKYKGLVDLVLNQSFSPISNTNKITILKNGEQKFPKVMEAIRNAKNHIHIEYYIFEMDEIGNQIIDLLIEKAKEGVKVRFIYDDFGSWGIKKRHSKKLRDAGIEIYPFYKIKLIFFANRINYRNHRKIIVIDGKIGFIGGINVCDKYINSTKQQLYWRDTHLMIEGPAVSTLQYVFIGDWNYCAQQKLETNRQIFPDLQNLQFGSHLAQMVASGPDSDTALIEQSICKAISLAKKEILITTPYYAPGDTISNIIMIAALSGVKVRILIPGKSDSIFVNLANLSHVGSLLKAGVEVYMYQKGFVHAKTIVIDGEIAIVGTANMDQRSFELNFEINAIIYEKGIAQIVQEQFYEDLKDSEIVDAPTWYKRKKIRKLIEKMAGLFSPMV